MVINKIASKMQKFVTVNFVELHFVEVLFAEKVFVVPIISSDITTEQPMILPKIYFLYIYHLHVVGFQK